MHARPSVHGQRPTASFVRAASLPLLVLLALAPPAAAQNARVWVSFDNQPEGTPAQLVLDAQASDPSVSVIDVTISGMWMTPRMGPDQVTYQDLEIPGLPNLTRIGAPRLPVARFDLGVVTQAQLAQLGQTQSLQTVVLQGVHVWPEPVEAVLHDGSPEQFTRDDQIYGSSGPWPAPPNPALPLGTMAGVVPYAEVELNPLHWNPATDQLEVQARSRTMVFHSGGPPAQPETVPKTLAAWLSHRLLNWSVVSPSLPPDFVHYSGYYLFVYGPAYRAALQPLIDQKLARGFQVAEVNTDTTGRDSVRIRQAILHWYAGTPRKADHFCLLVGDVRDVPTSASPPLPVSPSGIYSDDPYGSTDGLDLDKEILVGRLSADRDLDVRDQVARILAYEDAPALGNHFDRTLLVAHKDILDGTTIPIDSFQEAVRTATYATPPTFLTAYGRTPGVNTTTLIDQIDSGVGLLCYIGHSLSGGWVSWNLAGTDFTSGTLSSLANAGRTPLVWSFSCNVGFVFGEDCMGEWWLNSDANGAVGFYGPGSLTNSSSAAVLDRVLFDEVWNLGTTVQGYAYSAAELRERTERHDGEGWAYLLLGDPQMTIRRANPSVVFVTRPELGPCASGICDELRVGVHTSGGAPVPGALVGAWKPGASAARARLAGLPSVRGVAGPGDELLDNRYTGADGLARIPVSGLTDGWIHYAVQLDDGTSYRDSARVSNGAVVGVDERAGAASAPLRAAPSVTRAGTRFVLAHPLEAACVIEVFDLTGRRVAAIAVPAHSPGADWDARLASGGRAAAGVYLARIAGVRAARVTRIAVLR
jgi:hypothetical protein